MKRKRIQPNERYSGPPTKGCFKKGHKTWNKDKVGLQKSNKKGKTYEEIYGEEKSNKYKKIIKKRRSTQIFPLKDSKIEVKIQNFLKQLGIEFFTHQHIKIEHAYQCDILIPSMNLVIECDGNYWHKYPIGNKLDIIRTRELLDKGFRVLRFWESEIRAITLFEFENKINQVVG